MTKLTLIILILVTGMSYAQGGAINIPSTQKSKDLFADLSMSEILELFQVDKRYKGVKSGTTGTPIDECLEYDRDAHICSKYTF